MIRVRPALAVALPVALAGCVATFGEGGPHVQVWPSAEIDAGRIPFEETRTVEVTFRNVGPNPWRLEVLGEPGPIEIGCAVGEACDSASPGEEVVWALVVHAVGFDGAQWWQTRVRAVDPEEDPDGEDVHLDELTFLLEWTVCGRDLACDAPS